MCKERKEMHSMLGESIGNLLNYKKKITCGLKIWATALELQ